MARKTKADALLTRRLLIESAIKQFALRGVSETTLTDIAEAAGVTRGAVYWHFNNKNELFNEIWREQIPFRETIEHTLIQCEKDNPLEYMRGLFIASLIYIAVTPRMQALMQILYHKCEFNKDMMSESEIRQRIGFRYDNVRRLLDACIRNGSISAETNVELMLMILHSFFSGVIKNWLMDPERFNLQAQAPLLVDNILATLTTSHSPRASLGKIPSSVVTHAT
ncbi:acrEF/envCD operon transcriptional regulator [Pluralibacter sp.]|uniref:acrEF/envCD operon transcriptional regulator n=1 Tax=Pluralibacter sp. TaxID=1920032 RepID=UPI0025F695CF|nr:acrEF/envCD operon transcriptional regulator [Pluralibacter sp.]MBV8041386.1 acrEF/envCD operon transcriptional regulator [Pluralibacter sp.]